MSRHVQTVLFACLLCATFAQAQNAITPSVSGTGTANFLVKWTGTTSQGNSNVFQTTGGFLGIGTTTPAAKLDVKGGADIRGRLTLFPVATSPIFTIFGSTFKMDNGGRLTFVPGQVFPGTTTGVTSGTGLTGGASSGPAFLSLDLGFTDGRYAQLAAANTFGPDQFFNNNIVATLNVFATQANFNNQGAGAGTALFAANNDTSQTLQLNNVVAPANNAFMEAQFNGFGDAVFYTTTTGNMVATGTKSAAVSLPSGKTVKLFAVESPEVWFEDYGTASLVGGVATVNLDATFVQTVNTRNNYKVFLTPDGDCHGLYVAQKTPTSFEVRELGSGQASVDFDYRIVAHRKGHEKERMPEAALPRFVAAAAHPSH